MAVSLFHPAPHPQSLPSITETQVLPWCVVSGGPALGGLGGSVFARLCGPHRARAVLSVPPSSKPAPPGTEWDIASVPVVESLHYPPCFMTTPGLCTRPTVKSQRAVSQLHQSCQDFDKTPHSSFGCVCQGLDHPPPNAPPVASSHNAMRSQQSIVLLSP